MWSSTGVLFRSIHLLNIQYINDLPNVTKCHTTLFADDTNLHLLNENITTLQTEINKELKKLTTG